MPSPSSVYERQTPDTDDFLPPRANKRTHGNDLEHVGRDAEQRRHRERGDEERAVAEEQDLVWCSPPRAQRKQARDEVIVM